MLNDEAIRQVAGDRRRDRERDARSQRLAAEVRRPSDNRTDETESTAVLLHLLAARRHATS
jgi:hypothetical protein